MPTFRKNTMLFPGGNLFSCGKRKALTLSYDDGVLQDRRLVALMNQYGVRGTFNINSGLLGRTEHKVLEGIDVDFSTVLPQELDTLYENHEVATHGSRHTALTGCGPVALKELLEDRVVLEGLLPYLVRGHAYPFGSYDESVFAVLKAAGICYARTVVSTHTFELPKNFLAWGATCHHDDPELMELAERFCTQEPPYGQPQLFYLWGHSYEFDMHQNWDTIENFLAYVSGYKDEIWMATNMEIFNYITAYNSLVFSASGDRVYNPTDTEVWMESLDKIHQIPAGGTVTICQE